MDHDRSFGTYAERTLSGLCRAVSSLKCSISALITPRSRVYPDAFTPGSCLVLGLSHRIPITPTCCQDMGAEAA